MKFGKLIAILMIMVVCCTALVSCGDNEIDTSALYVKSSSDWELVKRKVDGKEKDDQVYAVKGGVDSNSFPNILICYYKSASDYKDEKSFYKDAQDISSVKAGDRTWEGYTYSLFGSSEACLTAKQGDGIIVCKFTLSQGGEKISVTDDDVKDILASIKVK